MRIKKYEEYKSTTVTWSNKIPEHWELLPTKRAFRRKKETNDGMKVGNRLALTMKGVLKRSLDDLDGLQASEYETYQIFQEGDLVFKLIDLQNIKTSRVGIVPEEGIMSPAYIRLEATGRVEPKYAYWYFMKLYHECIFNELGGGVRQTIGPEDLLSLPLTYPPKSEQHSIARFLDQETTKIDGLIAEQEKLIELLQEKRQAVISHAVTKGLNPNVPMKDSGVEWLEEVPEHWKITRLKHVTAVIDCRNKTPEYSEEGQYMVVRTTNIKNRKLDLAEAKYTDEDNFKIWTSKGIPRPGSIFFTREAPSGETALVPEGVPLCMGQRMMNIDTDDRILLNFILCFLQSSCLTRYIEACSMGSTVSHLRVPQVENIPLAIPSKQEQQDIASKIKSIDDEFDLAINELSSSLLLLKERRSSLISAAVTGQIDVRGLVSEEEAA